MKKILWLLLFLPNVLMAQKTHKVGPKETFYSIGRMYDVHPRELAEYNGLPFEVGLKLDQVIKIPASKKMAPLTEVKAENKPVIKPAEPAPTPQRTVSSSNANGTPIYHKVQKKETLYHIKTIYPPVSIDDIRKWNNLNADALNEGMNLIVGYQKTGTATTKTETVKTSNIKVEPDPKPEPVETIKPKQAETTIPSANLSNDKPEKSTTPAKASNRNFNGGKFKDIYSENANPSVESGTAAAFKSTSGWEDGRYYCLHNTAPAGTILKVTNKANEKVIYAKVLDVIPDLSQNKGLLLRISNAAADELGVDGDRFDVTVAF
jgi:LysM repeat protein